MVTSQRLGFIDALRGLAVIGVITFHCLQYSKPFGGALNTLLQQGRYGVQLFYVISAFTLFLTLSIRESSESNTVRNFFVRRFFRIAPLFWCAIVFYLLRDGLGPRYWLGDAPAITPANMLATATFTNGFNPYWINSIVPGGWSVAVEMVFYLTVPFLYKRIKTLDAAIGFTFVTLLISLVLQLWGRFCPITDKVLWSNYLFLWLPNQMPVFGLGIILFFLYRELQIAYPNIKQKQEKSRLMLAICVYVAAALAYGGYKFLPVHFLYGITFVGIAATLSINPFRFIVNGVFAYVGRISYSAYLTHTAVLPFAQTAINGLSRSTYWHSTAAMQYLLTVFIAIGGTILVSSITYYFIELPGQRLGRRVINGLDGRRTRSVPQTLNAGI